MLLTREWQELLRKHPRQNPNHEGMMGRDRVGVTRAQARDRRPVGAMMEVGAVADQEVNKFRTMKTSKASVMETEGEKMKIGSRAIRAKETPVERGCEYQGINLQSPGRGKNVSAQLNTCNDNRVRYKLITNMSNCITHDIFHESTRQNMPRTPNGNTSRFPHASTARYLSEA